MRGRKLKLKVINSMRRVKQTCINSAGLHLMRLWQHEDPRQDLRALKHRWRLSPQWTKGSAAPYSPALADPNKRHKMNRRRMKKLYSLPQYSGSRDLFIPLPPSLQTYEDTPIEKGGEDI